jgi:SPP1 family predicted phage head-tail adaptor
MQAGKLRHRMKVQTKVLGSNNYGEEVITRWNDDIKVWASVEPLRGKEYFNAQQTQSAVTHRVKFRYQKLYDETLIDSNCRLIPDASTSPVYEISSVVNPEMRNIYLECMCVAK